MRKWKYDVTYLNDNRKVFYCNGFVEAIILAMAYAIHEGWDKGIKCITDEYGVTIQDITYPKYKFSN